MIDQAHAKSITTQSLSVVFAALITTCGVIVAAFIQSGFLFGKQGAVTYSVAKPITLESQASFLGTLEPAAEMPIAAAREIEPMFDAHRISAHPSAEIEPVSALLPAANTPARLPAAETRISDAPKVFASPWTSLANPQHPDPRIESPSTAKKASDWGAITRFFKGHY